MNKAIVLKPLERQLKRIRKMRRVNMASRRMYVYETAVYKGLEKENTSLWNEENDLMRAINEIELFIENRKEIGEKVQLIAQLTNFK